MSVAEAKEIKQATIYGDINKKGCTRKRGETGQLNISVWWV